MPSPTSRTLAWCRKQGWTAQVVERWNPYSKTRLDLFNFVDVVALTGTAIIGIQVTSGSNVSARRAKILALDSHLIWLSSGGKIEIQSWSKRGPRGKRKTWMLKREEVSTCIR